MSDNLSFFRSSYFRLEEAGFVDPELFKLSNLYQKNLLTSYGGTWVVKPLTEDQSKFVAYGPTRIFQVNIFKSKSGNEVSLTLIINDQTSMKGLD
jgi:hypothetical protein